LQLISGGIMEEQLYRENILDHYKRPKNFKKIEKPDISFSDSNPLCGDEISFYLKISEDKIENIGFQGSACAICIASASMLSEKIKGEQINNALKFEKKEILSLLGINPGPARIKCALLPLKVLKMALYNYMAKKDKEIEQKKKTKKMRK
jgi:nitrogen fixation NifU-like protein